jgi:PAS domain S-box-containing protein
LTSTASGADWLNNGVGQIADAGDLDGNGVAVLQREIVGGNDARAGQQDRAVGEFVLAAEPADEVLEGAGHLAEVGFAAEGGAAVALDGEGVLFLGKAEMMLSHSDLFRPISLKHRIFARVPKVNLRDRLLVLAQAGNEDTGRRVAQEVRMRETAFDISPEAQIVVDATGKLALANDRARALFGLSGEDLDSRFQDLKLSYQPGDLRTPLEKVMSERRPLELDDVVLLQKGEPTYLKIQLFPLVNNGGRMLGVSLVFQEHACLPWGDRSPSGGIL